MSRITKIFDRIDMSAIFSQHLTTFYHYEKKKFHHKTEIPFSDKLLFLFLPLFFAAFLCLMGLAFDKDYVNITLTCLSIFIGLLFGLLTMVFSMVQENQKIKLENIEPEETKRTTARIDLTQHLFINIGFSISLSLLALIFVLLTQFYPVKLVDLIHSWKYFDYLKDSYRYITNGTSFFLIIEFLLTLMMIMRRFTILFLTQVS